MTYLPLADEQALNLVLLNLLQLIHKMGEVSGSFSLVLVNPAPEKQFANLRQTGSMRRREKWRFIVILKPSSKPQLVCRL